MLTSIFNDVIGPVMRGPSSSHCAAALRIGRLARDLIGGAPDEILVEFDRQGSLPTTHDTQGSDMGLAGGLLGWEADDERLPRSMEFLRESGTRLRFVVVDADDPHPNTYRLTLRRGDDTRFLRAISTGGGMIEVLDVDAFAVSMFGDCFETLLWVDRDGPELARRIAALVNGASVVVHESGRAHLVEVKTDRFLGDDLLASLRAAVDPRAVRRLGPVLPVLTRPDTSVPFTTCADMLRYDAGRNTPLWRLAVDYEMARGGFTEAEVIARMVDLVRLLRRSIAQGIAGTHYDDRVLGHQSGRYQERLQAGQLLDAGALNRAVLYVTALMEVKSSLGVIIAAPTAGACAALPAAVIALAETRGLGELEMAKALLAGGLIGVFIATHWSFAAEVGGCQAEGGSAACMAAGALADMAGGTLAQSVAAASMALQSMLGLICDPIANRVEAPCLGKNVMAASNAVVCANMALADYDPLIPLDEVIETAKRVAGQMPRELRCTALGGLSITPTSKAIEQRLATGKAAACTDCSCVPPPPPPRATPIASRTGTGVLVAAFVALGLGAVPESRAETKPEPEPKPGPGQVSAHSEGLHGYIGFGHEPLPAQGGYTAGMGFYAAVWSLVDRQLADFQIGLPSSWIQPDNSDNKDRPLAPEGTLARTWKERGPTWSSVFQTVEGGLGYWAGNHFRYGPPKFSMNATPQCYDYEVGSPGWSFFYDNQALPDHRLGIAQLSNRLLIPPDALPFLGRPNGEFLGYSWMALPFTDASAGDPPTGDQSWTCFLAAANFKGPIAYYIPETWSKIGRLFNQPFLHGRGLDARPGVMGGGAMEINTVPRFDARDTRGTNYSKLPKLQWPVNADGRAYLVQDVTYYSKAALYERFKAWRDGGAECSGRFDGQGAFKPKLDTRTTRYDQAGKKLTGVERAFDTRVFDGNVWGLQWFTNDLAAPGEFPRYYRHVGDERVAVAESAVPVETKLTRQEFKLATPGEPYTSPNAGSWAKPGPKSGPFTARLVDGSIVTYAWYRFVDQPSFQQYAWSPEKKAKLQAFVEKLHAVWPTDRDYMAPPTRGQLVSLDPALLVVPPPGFEIGYVPIVTRQSAP